MEISAKAKGRFCKDCNIPINIFHEPYFMDRINLFDSFFETVRKWNLFINELTKYTCEQDYFEEYNRVKDAAIECIKSSPAYQKFNEEDMNKYQIKNKGFPTKDIYKPSNHAKKFISIDMKKANFSALHYYSSNIFGVAATWEEFISKFTTNQHIINSKYIRQVILGNCNPRRQVTYEKYLMDKFLTILLNYIEKERVVFFSNDEIVLNTSDLKNNTFFMLLDNIQNNIDNFCVPLKTEKFLLSEIKGTNGYFKLILLEDNATFEFKCLGTYLFPFVIRKLLSQEVTENDKVFYHNGLLAKFIEIPVLSDE